MKAISVPMLMWNRTGPRNPMHTVAVISILAFALSGCGSSPVHQDLSPSFTTKTYVVEVKKDRIWFCGIDDPQVVADRPDDVWRESSKVGRFNMSMGERCLAEVRDALSRLRPAVQTAQTSVLIKSLRTKYSGIIDYHLARDGNWVIAEELCTRDPLDEEDVESFRKGPGIHVFLGSGSPGYLDLYGLLRQARDNVIRRWKQIDDERELKGYRIEPLNIRPHDDGGGIAMEEQQAK